MYPNEFRYTKDHEWLKLEGGEALVGVTDFAQHQLGDIIYVDLKPVGTKLDTHQPLATIESVKSVSDVFSPIAGEIIAVNDGLAQTADVINKDPHGQGWIARLRVRNPQEAAGLMKAAEYEKYLEGLEH